jgi:hypothetical protein
MAERLGRIGPPEAAQIGLAVAAGNHDSQSPIRRHAARRVDQVAAADAARLAQHSDVVDDWPAVDRDTGRWIEDEGGLGLKYARDSWTVTTRAGTFNAPVIVNAAERGAIRSRRASSWRHS